MSEDIFGEDIQFEIETSSRKNTDSRFGGVNGSSHSYIERLETKIQDQARRLSELENYKYIAEKRVKELNPNEAFPITEKSQRSKGEVKYDKLYFKYTKLLNDFNDLANTKGGDGSIKNTIGSSLSSESNSNGSFKKLKEAYMVLKKKTKETIEEKDDAINQLRQEALKVEEQKNIIAILKQTLDSEFVKSGVLTKSLTASNIIDFTQIKNESEQYRKQLVLSQALVNSLKSEIEEMIKDKEQTEKAKGELQTTNRGLVEKASSTERELNNKISQYQAEIGSMKKELELINTKLIEEVNSSESRFSPSATKRETDVGSRKANTIIELKSKMEELLCVYHHLNDEHKKALGQITTLKKENSQLTNQIDVMKQSQAATEESLGDYNQMKQITRSQQKEIESLTIKNNELDTLIEEADSKISDNYSMNKEINSKIISLETEIKRKNEQLDQFTDLDNKVEYFNQYIFSIKGAIKLLLSQTMQYTSQYNSIANENLNSILSDHFSQGITMIINQINNLPSINQFALDSTDLGIIKIITSLLKIITDEFRTICKKLFESNQYFNESHVKVSVLEEQHRQEAHHLKHENHALQKQLETFGLKHEKYENQLNQYQMEIDGKERALIAREGQLKEIKSFSNLINIKFAAASNEKTRCQNILHLIIKFIQSKELQNLIQEYLSVNETISKLSIEKANVDEKLASMDDEYNKVIKNKEINSSNKDLIDIINKEKTTLQELAYDFHLKIAEKDKRLNDITNELSIFLSNLQNAINYQKPSYSKLENKSLESNIYSTINQEKCNPTTRKVFTGNNYLNENQKTNYDDYGISTLQAKNSTIDITIISGNRSLKDGKYTYELNK